MKQGHERAAKEAICLAPGSEPPAASVSVTRRVLGAGAMITLSSVAVRAMSLLTTPITTRIFPPEAYGEAASVVACSSIFSALALASVDMGYVRFALSTEADAGQVERFCWRLGIGTSLLAMVLALALWPMVLAPRLHVSGVYAVVIALSVAAITFNSLAVTRRRLSGNFGRVAVAIAVGGVIAPVIVIGLGKLWRNDSWPMVLAGAAVPAVQLAVLGVPRVMSLARKAQLPPGLAKKILRLSAPALATMPGYWVLTSSDRWFLVGMAGEHVAGIYSVAASVGMMGSIVNGAATLIWYPEVARLVHSKGDSARAEVGRVWSRLVILLGMVWFALAAGGGDAIRLITPSPYHSAAHLVPLIAAACFFAGFGSLAATGLFVSGRFEVVALIWVVAAVLSVSLNAVLIPRFESLGAAATMTAAFALIAVATFAASQRRWPMKLQSARLVLSLCGLAAAGLLFHAPWHHIPIYSLLIKLGPCALLAASILVVTAPEWAATRTRALLRRVP